MIIALAGCGGSAVPPVVLPAPDFVALDQNAQSLVTTYDATAFTDLSTLPTSASASYQGFLGATIYNNLGNRVTRIVGAADMTVTFGNANITATGNVTQFQDETDGAMQGTLVIASGVLDPSADPTVDPTFTALASGLLRWDNNLGRQIDIVLEGDLRGQDHAALGGEVLGRHTASGGSGDVIGSFILAR